MRRGMYFYYKANIYISVNSMINPKKNLAKKLGEEKLQKIINFCLHYMSGLDIPIKRGHFIEYRSGMLNVSAIGRDCNVQERFDFEEYDKIHNIRSKFAAEVDALFPGEIKTLIGGQISMDVTLVVN